MPSTTVTRPAPSGPLLARRRFRAMNTDVQVLAMDWRSGARLAEAERVFRAVEARFSRFLPSSELSRVNARSGDETEVSPEMLALLGAALALHRRTGGAFDPGVLRALEASGYDRSFEQVARESDDDNRPWRVPTAPFAATALDEACSTVRLPRGMRIDLGGIGKGYAVDAAMRALAPLRDVLVDAGGDMAARGDGPDGDGWVVAVEHPHRGEEDVAVLRLRDQALATSTVTRRRWRRGDRWRHHLIDPGTGEAAETDVASVSVVAATAMEADVLAKAALVLGRAEGARLLGRERAAGLYVFDDGSAWRTAGWPADPGGLPGEGATS